ncbi:MAG: D-tyrosyl-tRNA(Tyr) deacylase [Oscillospiraceae bacterium]|nr:D-tyrosyl-tRNA(Tyr) deacylase [Oscillospiraceae bacterium]
MRALLQRVKKASVTVDGKVIGSVGEGYLILLGVREGDTVAEARFLAQKTAELRVFTDPDGKMNLSMMDVGGGALVVSQFTLYADCKKGRRPSFIGAMKPPVAEELYLDYVRFLKEAGVSHVETGEFGADMLVSIDNDGPVTIMLDTDEIMKKG